MTGIIDTHAHYDDEAFDEDREQLLLSLKEQGILKIVNIGASFDSNEFTLKLAEKYDFIKVAFGIHPNYADKINEDNFKYSITAYRNDGKVIKYSYYSTSASLAIERVEEGTVTGDGVSWGTPTYGNICAMEEIRTVTKAIDKLLAGEELLPDEDILG